MATCTNELQFYSTADGTRVLSPAAVRDKKWATITVPIGWSVQGCWKPEDDRSVELSAANSMEESARIPGSTQFANNRRHLAPYVTCVHRSPDLKYLAKGCIDGSVAVYNYPTHAPGMSMIKVPGHGSSIAKVRFTSDGKYLIALGRFNRTITQYKIQQLD